MGNKIRIGITQGDTNGIGWETILKAIADPRMCELYTMIIYGSPAAASYYKNTLHDTENVQLNIIDSAAKASSRQANIVPAGEKELKIEPGISTQASGAAAVAALQAAVKDLKEGLIDALVTAPISKSGAGSAGFGFTGHTEYLASESEGTPIMMMCSERLKVALATTHTPLENVAASLTKEGISEKLCALRRTLIADFGIVEPKIAVLALNPHAGEQDMLGTQETEIIKPAIEDAAGKGVLAFGPMAADGFFLSGAYAKYDAVLAMYHDQGLAPFKALTPDGVNYTAGLGIIRTSPDHGTAFDIAGQDKASADSLRNAIYLAADICRHRASYAEMSRNPLRHYEQRGGGADLSVSDLKLPQQEDEQ